MTAMGNVKAVLLNGKYHLSNSNFGGHRQSYHVDSSFARHDLGKEVVIYDRAEHNGEWQIPSDTLNFDVEVGKEYDIQGKGCTFKLIPLDLGKQT